MSVSAGNEEGRTPSEAEFVDKEGGDVIISISRSDCGGTRWQQLVEMAPPPLMMADRCHGIGRLDNSFTLFNLSLSEDKLN